MLIVLDIEVGHSIGDIVCHIERTKWTDVNLAWRLDSGLSDLSCLLLNFALISGLASIKFQLINIFLGWCYSSSYTYQVFIFIR